MRERHYTSAEFELVRLSRYVQEHFAHETPTEEPVVDCVIRLMTELRLARTVIETVEEAVDHPYTSMRVRVMEQIRSDLVAYRIHRPKKPSIG